MVSCASGCGRGGGATARALLAICVLALGLAPSWAEGDQAKQTGGENAPAVTLRTLVVGACQEIQSYAESALGSGVIRSAAEVRPGAPSNLLNSSF